MSSDSDAIDYTTKNLKVTLCVQNLVSARVLCSNLSSLGTNVMHLSMKSRRGEGTGRGGPRQGMGRGFDIFQKIPVKFPVHWQIIHEPDAKTYTHPGLHI